MRGFVTRLAGGREREHREVRRTGSAPAENW